MTSIVNKVYVLAWLNFTDDYKHRGGDWAYLKEPRVFNNYKDAKKALEELLIEYINSSDLDLETMKEIGIEYFKKIKVNDSEVESENEDDRNKEDRVNEDRVNEEGSKKVGDQDKKEDEEEDEEEDKYEFDENAEYIFDPEELDFDDFEYIVEALSKGEYVSRKIYYEIHTCKLEDSKN